MKVPFELIYSLMPQLHASLRIVIDGNIVRSSAWESASYSQAQSPKPGTLAYEIVSQLNAYCKKKLKVFDLPLAFVGTDFEQSVWRTVATIPFSYRVSYADVARAVGRPGAHRGVARAMSTLAFALFVPAHRVVGADGKVKGASATSTRVHLLEFEAQR